MKRRIRIELDKDVSDALKQYCKDKGLNLSQAVEEALRWAIKNPKILQKIAKRLSKNAK